MLTFINSIPESIGWASVGFVLAIGIVLIGNLISYGIKYIKDCTEGEEMEAE